MRNPDRDFPLLAVGPRAKPAGRLWTPAADVYRSDDAWIVKIDLAGVRTEDLEIVLQDKRLRIRGCRRDTSYKQGFVYEQMEITYSHFEKLIEFSRSLEGATVTHEYRDGFLLISIRYRPS